MGIHKPVLLKEVIELLEPKSGENFIDCNYGSGGHSRAILERIKPAGHILAIDADPGVKGDKNIKLINDNFVNLKAIYERNFPYPVSGILFDLGFSSDQLENSGRGFSFLTDEPLDMRYNPEGQRLTAKEILNKYGAKSLVRIFREFGEVKEKLARKVAWAIVARRGRRLFEMTSDLLEVISENAVRHKRIHPATQFFQALRIEVNKELDNLRQILPQAVEILKPALPDKSLGGQGGRLAVISFHSLEDRIVKNYFRDWARQGKVELLTKKPLTAGEEELKSNPRARSAKLRAIKKFSD
ncbi:16S rRNA (cytosine(1402)-N(4))-methyltransferase [Candidatus Kuenenbacteria bacterium RIFCSPHIGHO2_02_FULL_39_13]|uniref:Ribosomal RNA small subunit methyltransferase H n=1 Tax=Candidatus Kuenenbacteria bacterium RIFCSPHIGHO2_02_FULL_39_13 TaxID=1798561 RepID=A0A1F6FMW9_9BACT|nr:MAG: 16S rRNA (cytosine(1402)-N(4))-methyltransferase [Candidatus Kuenenbacteria bacterium RIFCSPHIGHO2_02_FULL_39_13]